MDLTPGSGANAYIECAGTTNTAGATSALYGQDSSSVAYCWNRANAALLFGTNGTERARITSGGQLLVGTTSNANNVTLNVAGTLEASGSGKSYIYGAYAQTVGATNRDVFVDDTGALGYVASIQASKTNIQSINDISWLLELNPVTFNYRKKDLDGNYTNESDGGIQHGLIAEDVETIKPELCFYDEIDGKQELRGVSYSKLITPMLKLIQQQQAAIVALEAKVAALEAK